MTARVEPPYTANDVIEALEFLLRYPSPFAFNDVEDEKEFDELSDRWIEATNIREWNRKNGNGWIK